MTKRAFFRRPHSWVVWIILSVVAIIYISGNFDKANSLLHVDISMDRESALEKSIDLSKEFSLGPQDFRQAVAFSRDRQFQTFVELEAGGLDSFQSCISKGYYSPFYWQVRQFKEHDAHEVTFWFKPNGEPYGFKEKIPEADEGEALLQDEAQRVAEHMAAYYWDVDLTPYKLAEKTKEEQISGRVDHSFVYERTDLTIGEGKYRIRLRVSGDKLSEVNYFVKVPEAFNRRYEEMRSDNDTIATIASGVILVIYGLLGVLLALFLLIRKRYLIWKPATLWGLGIAFASVFLLTLNSLQLSWFSYDTSSSEGNFLLRQLINGLTSALGFGAIIAVSVMAAEGLGRMAFPRHLQFWNLWTKDAGASKQVLGQTVGGYLFAIVILAIDVWFYVNTTTHFGWWSPAGTLSDPNILANHLPWLDSIATSLQAGFWEEALFRAVPLAGVFLLVKNKKSKVFWMALTLLVQTLIFGAAHANYPNQPSYARILEMIIPFTIMGVIYIYYGLLPAIIAHYAVDVFWISLPLWVSSAPGIWIDRIMVVLFLLFPIWVVLFFYLKNKKLNNAPETLRNGAWKPAIKMEEPEIEQEESKPEIKRYKLEKWLIAAGITGLLIWLVTADFSYDVPTLDVSKKEAVKIAKDEVSDRFGLDPEGWEILTSISSTSDIKDIFVWREGGKEIYSELMNRYLPPPYWNVRFIKKTGDVETRAEEFNVLVTTGGKVYYASHHWPESAAGANLSREQAEIVVDSFLAHTSDLRSKNLKQVSVSPDKLENRTDWDFVYADTADYPLAKGQGRYRVKLSGKEVSIAYPFVYVPEDWIRDYKEQNNKLSIIRTTGQVILLSILAFGLIIGIIRWTKKKFHTRLFVGALIVFFSVYMLDSLNSWSTVVASYQTQLPFSNFLTMMLISLLVVALFMSLFNAIILGASVKLIRPEGTLLKNNILYAAALGVFLYGIFSWIKTFGPELKPFWPSPEGMNSFLPVFNEPLSSFSEILIIPAFMMTLFVSLDIFTGGFQKGKIPAVLIILIVGFALTVSQCENWVIWSISAIISGGIILSAYLFFIRYHFEWLPLTFGVFPIMKAFEILVSAPYPQARAGAVILIIISAGVFVYWYRKILSVDKG